MTALEMAKLIHKAADDKKAKDILILDMEGICDVTDYFIICSGNSNTQVQAIADNIEDELAKEDCFIKNKEGYNEANWVLLDYSFCVVHIFQESEREFYNLERLWGRAPVVEMLSE